jgi:hypothetical protein
MAESGLAGELDRLIRNRIVAVDRVTAGFRRNRLSPVIAIGLNSFDST